MVERARHLTSPFMLSRTPNVSDDCGDAYDDVDLPRPPVVECPARTRPRGVVYAHELGGMMDVLVLVLVRVAALLNGLSADLWTRRLPACRGAVPPVTQNAVAPFLDGDSSSTSAAASGSSTRSCTAPRTRCSRCVGVRPGQADLGQSISCGNFKTDGSADSSTVITIIPACCAAKVYVYHQRRPDRSIPFGLVELAIDTNKYRDLHTLMY
jgi:hypothetical protein